MNNRFRDLHYTVELMHNNCRENLLCLCACASSGDPAVELCHVSRVQQAHFLDETREQRWRVWPNVCLGTHRPHRLHRRLHVLVHRARGHVLEEHRCPSSQSSCKRMHGYINQSESILLVAVLITYYR